MHDKTYQKLKTSVIQAAAGVIRQFGIQKTTMSDIAKALHMSKSSLYHYFTRKEDIFLEVFRTEVSELRGEFLKAIEAEPTPEGKLRAYILTRTEMYRRKLKQHMEFLEATAERYDLLLRIHAMFDADEMSIISKILEQGNAQGRFAVGDVQTVAMVMVIAFRAFEYPFSADVQPTELDRHLDSLLAVIFNGLHKR